MSRNPIEIATYSLKQMADWLGRTIPAAHPARGQVLTLLGDAVDVLNDYLKEARRG